MDAYERDKRVTEKLADLYEKKIEKLTTMRNYETYTHIVCGLFDYGASAFMARVEERTRSDNEGKAVHAILLRLGVNYQETAQRVLNETRGEK